MALSLVNQGKKMASQAASNAVQSAGIRERGEILTKPCGKAKKEDDPIDELVKLAASGIGLISEVIHHRREKKKLATKTGVHQVQEPNGQAQGADAATAAEQTTEAIWELDDAKQHAVAQEEDSKSSQSSQSPEGPKDLAKAFLQRHPSQPEGSSNAQLALPVILAQRRPEKRARGFVRAYSPVLADVGIDQETFLDFIDTFNKALEPNQWINVILLADVVGMVIPDPMLMLVGFAAQVAADLATEAHSRFRSNTFLDTVNRGFFIPRGFVCLVVTWRSDTADDEVVATVNFEGVADKTCSKPDIVGQMKDMVTQKTSLADGKQQLKDQVNELMEPSTGAFECLQPAPLIFPSLDKTAITQYKDGKAKKKNAVDRAEIWLDDFMDKRTQAKWIDSNPDLPMANMLPKPEFRSRYADPNHPASSGDVVAVLTGGRWQYKNGKPADGEEGLDLKAQKKEAERKKAEQKKAEKKETEGKKIEAKEYEERMIEKKAAEKDEAAKKKAQKKEADKKEAEEKKAVKKRTSKSKSETSQSQKDTKKSGGWKSLLQKDILYLVIVNLPHPADQMATVSDVLV
ncbi:hypothetical protein B0J13DRAFT_646539 [Dactylonectria estremocensis]|uniref:Uncharacterized protein n=1 Tax=Dactylonectria estremocensis TaxID=1079267 RepID=A0A9P9DXV8_9HYPO|nr:hypothetical protein B0J13DRAFT_646539 [Dactylonectria estremocensis]